MAQNSVNSGGSEGKLDWQAARLDRIETTRLVWRHILDPIMTFAELVRGYGHDKGVDFNPEEISAVLRLIALGGYTETKTYCTFGGNLRHVSGELLEKEVRNWDTGEKGGLV